MTQVYIVWDTYNRKMWKSGRDHIAWPKPKLARYAWEAETGNRFEEQIKYQIHEAEVVRGMLVDSKEYLK